MNNEAETNKEWKSPFMPSWQEQLQMLGLEKRELGSLK